MQKYINTILRGIGQVMLQNNALSGLLFLSGIFYNSWLMGLGAIIGCILGTITATLLKYVKEDIEEGLYGFNGTLVGIAVCFYFGFNIATVFAIIIGAAVSTIIMHSIKNKLPAYTAPFIIISWILIIVIKFLNLSPFLSISSPENKAFDLLSMLSMGFGQVMFQADIITGIVFFLAIVVNSSTAAIYAFYGSLLGGLFALLIGLPIVMINIGLFGYNAVLCGIALEDKNWKALLSATIAIVLSVLLNLGLDKLGIITLTAPFVIATWTVLLIKKIGKLSWFNIPSAGRD